MKLKMTLLAVTLAAFAASTVYAAENHPADANKAEAKAPAKKDGDHEMMEKHMPMKDHKQHNHPAEKGAESKGDKGHHEMMEKHMPMQDHK